MICSTNKFVTILCENLMRVANEFKQSALFDLVNGKCRSLVKEFDKLQESYFKKINACGLGANSPRNEKR